MLTGVHNVARVMFGDEYVDYRFGSHGLEVSEAITERFIARAVQLHEQGQA